MDQDRLERLIAGPWTVHPGNGYTLEQLQNHRFTKHMTSGERAVCRMAAKHILEHFDLVPKKVQAEPVMKVSRLQESVLLELASHDPETGVHTLRSLATMMIMEVRDVRLAARALARKGLADRTYLYDEYNAHILGSGYVATAAGRQLADEINQKGNS